MQPCGAVQTFASAMSKTLAGGEVNVLDPGSFGALTITKALTVSSEFAEAGVQVSGVNGIVVNVPNATDEVILRGLDIEGLGTGAVNSLPGIKVITGGSVHVEKCTVHRFTSGIDFAPTVANSKLFVVDRIVRGNGNTSTSAGQGIFVGSAKVSLDHVRLENNVTGLKVQGPSRTEVNNSVAAGNVLAGFSTSGSPAVLNIERSVSTHNGTGLIVAASTSAAIGNTSITDNGTLASISGTLFTFKNNNIGGGTLTPVTPVNPQ